MYVSLTQPHLPTEPNPVLLWPNAGSAPSISATVQVRILRLMAAPALT